MLPAYVRHQRRRSRSVGVIFQRLLNGTHETCTYHRPQEPPIKANSNAAATTGIPYRGLSSPPAHLFRRFLSAQMPDVFILLGVTKLQHIFRLKLATSSTRLPSSNRLCRRLRAVIPCDGHTSDRPQDYVPAQRGINLTAAITLSPHPFRNARLAGGVMLLLIRSIQLIRDLSV